MLNDLTYTVDIGESCFFFFDSLLVASLYCKSQHSMLDKLYTRKKQ